MKESNALRGVCVEFREADMDFPWMDEKSRIRGILRAWRAAFPTARAVNVMWRRDIVDSDFFVYIRGGPAVMRLHIVYLSGCRRVMNSAFVHLRGIQKLDMSWCNQATITGAAFMHLREIFTLYTDFFSPAIQAASAASS